MLNRTNLPAQKACICSQYRKLNRRQIYLYLTNEVFVHVTAASWFGVPPGEPIEIKLDVKITWGNCRMGNTSFTNKHNTIIIEANKLLSTLQIIKANKQALVE